MGQAGSLLLLAHWGRRMGGASSCADRKGSSYHCSLGTDSNVTVSHARWQPSQAPSEQLSFVFSNSVTSYRI